MRLCGINIPYEMQLAEKVASNRIHNLAEETANSKEILAYDNADIAGALISTEEAAQGIWRAVQSKQLFDINKQRIDLPTVKVELNILSQDLRKIAEVVERILNTEEGKSRWSQEIIKLWDTEISIPNQLKALVEISTQFQTFADTIPE
jgi:hypothetical protein